MRELVWGWGDLLICGTSEYGLEAIEKAKARHVDVVHVVYEQVLSYLLDRLELV